MPELRSGGEQQVGLDIGGWHPQSVDPQQERGLQEGTLESVTDSASLVADDVAVGSAVRRCEAHVDDGEFHEATVGSEVCEACDVDVACSRESETLGAPPTDGVVVTTAVASTAPWQGAVVCIEEAESMQCLQVDSAECEGQCELGLAQRSQGASSPLQVAMAEVESLDFGGLGRDPFAPFRTDDGRRWRSAQRDRMELYEAAAQRSPFARSPCLVSWSRECDNVERSGRYVYGLRGGVPRHPIRPVATAEASAFALPQVPRAPLVPIPDQRPNSEPLVAKPVLVLFAGCDRRGSLRRALRRRGYRVETFEILEGKEQDLSVQAVQRAILARVHAGEFAAVYLGTPCASFCTALQPQLRSVAEKEGVTPVPPEWRAYLQRHNGFVRFSAEVILRASHAGTVWMIENPASQRSGVAEWSAHADRPSLWDMPCIDAAMRATRASRVTFAQCCFGSKYRKYTTIMSCRASAAPLRERFAWARCSCERHEAVAAGRDEFGESLSAPAAAYPPAMNEAIADAVIAALHASAEPCPLPPSDRPQGLQVGSADPHMLRLNDDKVARSRRAPTFSVLAHEPATTAELMARPLAVLNEPPVTVPREPPVEQPSGAPVVRSMRDVFRPIWAKRISTWLRRVRRCVRLSQQGRWQLARRLRPPDLWVSAEASMLPEAAPWDWDLRPLVRGEPAVPTLPSSAQRQPMSSFAADVVTRDLASGEFGDRAILAEMISGITDDVVGPRGSFLCAPHPGGLRFAEEARQRLQAGVDDGYAVAYSALPYWPIRCDPYSVVDESERAGTPKFRLTNDHSWPPPATVGLGVDSVANAFVPSLNAAMERQQWPEARMIRVRELAEAAAVLATSGVPVKLAAIDIKAFYKNFGRQVAEHHRNGSLTQDGVIIDERCCFGSAADATKCCRISNYIVWRARRKIAEVDARYPSQDPRVIAWQLRRRELGAQEGASPGEIDERWASMSACGMYVDDAVAASIDDALFELDGSPVMRNGVQLTRATAHYETLRESIIELGLTPTKEQPPADEVAVLGVMLSLRDGRMRLQQRKRERYAAAARSVATSRTCDRDVFVSLLGRLTFASTCYPRGRQWLHAAWRAMRVRFRTRSGDVVMSQAVRDDLVRWAVELEDDDHPGVPLASVAAMPPADSEEVLAVYADAAGAEALEGGFGAWAVVGSELLYVEGQWTDEERASLIIADLELAASTFGLVALAEEASVRHVYSFTDNTVAMAAMRRLTPSRPVMQQLIAARVSWMMERGINEAVERVTSKANTWADDLSRGRLQWVLDEATRLGLRPRRVQVAAEWRSLTIDAARDAARVVAGAHVRGDGSVLDECAEPRCHPHRTDCVGAGGGVGDGGRSAGARGVARSVHRGGDSGGASRPAADRCALVAEVRSVRPPACAVDGVRADGQLAGEDRRGESAGRLCHMAGDLPAVRPADLGADGTAVHAAGAAMASADLPDGAVRGPRQFSDYRGVQGRGGARHAAAHDSQVGRPHTGPLQGDGAGAGEERRGRDVARSAISGLLRVDEGMRARPPAGRGVLYNQAPHAGGRTLPALAGDGRDVRGSDDARGQDGDPQGARGDHWLGWVDGRCAASADRYGASRPDSGSARARPHPPVSQSGWLGDYGGPAAAGDQDAHGAPGARPPAVWGAQPADWRGDGGAGCWPVASGDTCSGAMGLRRVYDLHAAQPRVGIRPDGSDWLIGLRGRGAVGGLRRRGADLHHGGDATGRYLIPRAERHRCGDGRRGGGLGRRGRALTRAARDRAAWLASQPHKIAA